MSESGRAVRVARGSLHDGDSYSITVLTSLTHPNGFIVSNPRRSSNTAIDFFLYMVDLVQEGHLVAGDVLVLDNAAIHFADDIQAPLRNLLTAVGARLLFMPTYSPELNPCEYIFAQLKSWLREQRSRQPLLVDIGMACHAVSWHNVFSYYDKCIHRFHEY
jgi:transposase